MGSANSTMTPFDYFTTTMVQIGSIAFSVAFITSFVWVIKFYKKFNDNFTEYLNKTNSSLDIKSPKKLKVSQNKQSPTQTKMIDYFTELTEE